MCISEADPLLHEPIQIRRSDSIIRVVSLNVPDTEIIGQNHNDVRLFGGHPGIVSHCQAAQREKNCSLHL